MSPQLVLFDLMGTLLAVADERVPYWERIGVFLESEGIVAADVFASSYSEWRSSRKPSRREVALRDRIEMFASVSADQHRNIERNFIDDYAQRTRVIDGVESMLQSWGDVCELGVVSNFFLSGAPEELLRRHGLLHHFAFVIDSARVGVRKPSAEIFKMAISASSIELCPPTEVLMIGDDWEADVEGALAMGFRAAHFTNASFGKHEHVLVVQNWQHFRPAS